MRLPFLDHAARRQIEPFTRSSDGTWMSYTDAYLERSQKLSFTGSAEVAKRRIERRAITSVPWDVGDSRWTMGATSMETAARLGAVFAAARLLATSVSSLPIHTYRKTGRVREQLPNPQLFTNPSRHGTFRDWCFRCMTSLVLAGNAYGLITSRDGHQLPTRIEWLHPSHVTVDDGAMSGPGSYLDPIWRWQGRVVPSENILHIPWFTVPWRIKGLSPIEAFAAPWYSAMAAHEYIGDWFANGGIPPGKFKNSARKVEFDEAKKIRAMLTQVIKSHESLVYGRDWDYDAIMIPPRDAMFIDLLKLTATDIAAIYGIPAEKIGGQTAGNLTYQTVELQSIDYLQFTLLGWVDLLERAFFELMPRPRYVKFNVDSLIRPDLKTRHEVYEIDRRMGLYSIDELREKEDEPPLPDGQGSSYTPLQVMVSESKTPAPPAAPAITRAGQLLLPFEDLPVPVTNGRK